MRRFSLSLLLFSIFQRLGFHLTRNNFYSPIPDTRVIAKKRELFLQERELPGVDINLSGQLRFLNSALAAYSGECNFSAHPTHNPYQYYVNNRAFGFLSAAVLHCMVRHYKPQTLIEVGSGFSTLVSAAALLQNRKEGHSGELICIEPYPSKLLFSKIPGLTQLIATKVEELKPDFFNRLGANDILFVDSSHVLRLGGDVRYLYLDILPRLKKGVIIHIHDIFFPNEYPRDWVLSGLRFWNEQYLLQAFLCNNHAFQILFCAHLLSLKYSDKLRSVFPLPPALGSNAKAEYYSSSSFWMKKIR